MAHNDTSYEESMYEFVVDDGLSNVTPSTQEVNQPKQNHQFKIHQGDNLLELHNDANVAFIKQYLDKHPEDGIEFHFPGMNYMGPGTHTLQRIIKDSKPQNHNDAVSLEHDLDYMVMDKMTADVKAIHESEFSLDGLALKLGLTARTALDLLTKGLRSSEGTIDNETKQVVSAVKELAAFKGFTNHNRTTVGDPNI